MEKQFIKDCEYMDLEDLRGGSFDPSITIDGVDYINHDVEDAIKAFKDAGICNDKCVIIPKGTIVKGTKEVGGAIEYTLEYNDKTIVVDIAFDDEDEFIK